MEHGYASTPEGQVHYITAGEGEPLVLLHQNPRSSREFLAMTPILAKDHRVYALDLLGCGSSGPLPEGEFGLLDLARNVVHVMDALGIESSDFFGCHTGSLVTGDQTPIVMLHQTASARRRSMSSAQNARVPGPSTHSEPSASSLLVTSGTPR